MALGGRPALWIQSVDLQPYAAAQLPLYYFYFPRGPATSGADVATPPLHAAFPAAAASRGRVLAVAFGQSSQLQVRGRGRG